MPGNVQRISASVPTKPPDADAYGGVGLTLIKHSVDEVSFFNHGRRGKELRLTRYLLDDVKAAPAKALEDLPSSPRQTYQVRPMQTGEALQVARVFWLAYGYSYKNEKFYQPDGLLHLIGSGQLISFVAVAENGEVVGHAGLVRSVPAPTAEGALLVVSPAHRGRGLIERLTAMLLSAGHELGLYGLHSNAATSHPVSQRETDRSGGVPCGLDLAAYSRLFLCWNPPLRGRRRRHGEASTPRDTVRPCATTHLPEVRPQAYGLRRQRANSSQRGRRRLEHLVDFLMGKWQRSRPAATRPGAGAAPRNEAH